MTEKRIVFSLAFNFLTLFLFLSRNFYIQKFKFYLLGFFFFSLGVFAHFLRNQPVKLPQFNTKERIVFKMQKKLNSNEKNRRYEVAVLDCKSCKDKTFFPFNSVLSIPKSEFELDFQHYYKAEAYINRVQAPQYDFSFNYQKYLARKSIHFQTYLPNSYRAAVRNDLSFSEKIRQKRLETLHKIDSAKLSPKTKEFTKGIILADRTEMDEQTVQDFSKSGLVHILAISGSHMAIIFWLILLLLKPVFPTKLRYFQIIIALVLIWAFAVFIDYGSSVVRSCIMISVYYLYVLLQRKPDLLHAMALSAFIILIFDSNQLFDVGFQLSYAAVFGILWLNQPILKYLPKPKNNFQNFLVNVPSISMAAQITTFPLVIFYFHQYSFISLPANLVVIPFSEIIIIFSLLMTVLLAFSFQFSGLNIIYEFFVSELLKIIHFFGNIETAFIKNIPMSLAEVVVLFFGVYFLRFLILKFNVKNSFHFLGLILLYSMLKTGFGIFYDRKNEILTHDYFKQTFVSVKEEKKVIFLVKENADLHKITKFVIDPYLTSRRTDDCEIKFLPKEAEAVKINGKLYPLENKK
ncbi:MAG: ComEC family competence protein [Kaistella sp.]|nr:ComEC family competence protein [Kaistella sp.]